MKGSVVYSPVMQSQTEMELHSIIINHPHPHYHQSTKIVFVLACAVVALFHGDPSSACPLLPFLGSKFASKPWIHSGLWTILEGMGVGFPLVGTIAQAVSATKPILSSVGGIVSSAQRRAY